MDSVSFSPDGTLIAAGDEIGTEDVLVNSGSFHFAPPAGREVSAVTIRLEDSERGQ